MSPKVSNAKVLHALSTKSGGFAALGREFGGISGWAVQKWCLSGVVPAERVPTLIDLAARYGIPVSPWHVRPDVYPIHWFKPPT